MLVKFFAAIPCLILLSGCQLLPFKNFPMEIKAVIDGEIKGHKIHCEKRIDLADGRWGVMCDVDNDMDVKYRVRPMNNDITQIEFVLTALSKKIGTKMGKLPNINTWHIQMIYA